MLSAEQGHALLLDVQRQVGELQLGAAGQAQNISTMASANAQTLATMQAAIAAIFTTLAEHANAAVNAGDGGHDRGGRGNSETRINHTAAKGLAPREWIGEKDPVSFAEFSAEFVNYACAMNAGAKHLLEQAARNMEAIDITLDLRQEPFIDGLAEILDDEFYRQLFKVTKGESRIIVQNAGQTACKRGSI
jgi:hypothetical protein